MILLHLAFTDAEHFDYWNSWGPALGQCEINLAIIAACIPTLKAVVAAWVPSVSSSSSEADYGNTDNCFATTSFGGTRVRKSVHVRLAPDAFALSSVGHTHTTIRGHPLDESEAEIMTSDGIVQIEQVSIWSH